MAEINYDQKWTNEWYDRNKFGPYAKHIRRLALDLLRPLSFRTVLDIGCGLGFLIFDLITAFPNIEPTGSDLSASGISIATQIIPSGNFCVLDISKESLDQKFDLITCLDVLEHIPDDSAALANIASMSDGYFLAGSVQGRMRSIEPTAFGHIRNYFKGELPRKIEAAGFQILRTAEWGFPFYSPLYRDFNNLIAGKGSSGKFGPGRKYIAKLIYYIFYLNSRNRGDVIFVLAKHK